MAMAEKDEEECTLPLAPKSEESPTQPSSALLELNSVSDGKPSAWYVGHDTDSSVAKGGMPESGVYDP